jgi:hypothetical protein
MLSCLPLGRICKDARKVSVESTSPEPERFFGGRVNKAASLTVGFILEQIIKKTCLGCHFKTLYLQCDDLP